MNGRYWSYDLPENLPSWRSQYAAKGLWNKDGYYVEYVIGQDGLPVWEGKAASQLVKDNEGNDIENWMVEGGGTQIFAPTSWQDIPADLPLKPTNWSNDG